MSITWLILPASENIGSKLFKFLSHPGGLKIALRYIALKRINDCKESLSL